GDTAVVARAAVVASGAAVVRLRQHRSAADGGHAAHLGLETVAEPRLAAGKAHRRLEDRVRQLRQPFGQAADADVALDLLVVRHEVLIGDRPVDAVAVAARGLHVDVAHAVGLAAPGQRAAADL